MNIPIHVIAYYNTDTGVRPLYISVDNVTYRIEDIVHSAKERFAGTRSILFRCLLEVAGITHEILLRYHIGTHQWILIGGEENTFLYSAS